MDVKEKARMRMKKAIRVRNGTAGLAIKIDSRLQKHWKGLFTLILHY